ncbi:MAG: class D beta-lactamase [Cyanosarcina radialis HA8281-LM2]|jgi:beta-lactamase class D|nr:class D beta-lactamase [Cyanosarcina radialis HA8281-LM2]
MRFSPKSIRLALSIAFGIILLFACSLTVRSQFAPTDLTASGEIAIAKTPNLEKAFQELRINGSIAIYDKNNQQFYERNPARNNTAFFPGSTFKILNALISLETGTVRDDVAVLTWDGIVRQIPAWNRDTNLRQAFKDSTVWFYQVLARKNGHERMQNFVEQSGYGNRQIGTPDKIDRFWLEGPLQITPKQQIEFLQRLERNDLPFSQRAIDLVKDIMIIEKTPEYTWRSKTGWIDSVNPNIGWIVGYLEQNDNVYFFATNMVMTDAKDAPKRLEVTRRSFKALGLL